MTGSPLIQALKSYVQAPGVWLSGIVSCLGILAIYLAFIVGGGIPAFLVFILVILVVPFFFAGTYGVILDNNRKRGAFLVYGAYGYFKTLLPWLFLLLVILVADLALNYFLLVAGLSPTWILVICCLIIFPFIFYFYFSDICAIRHNLRTWQAIKTSARTVSNASFSVIAFYMIHILLILFIIPIVFNLMFTLFGGYEVLFGGFMDILNNYGITDITSINTDAILQNMSEMSTDNIQIMATSFVNVLLSPEVIRALFFSLAFIALIFMPFLVSYKSYYYQKLVTENAIRTQAAANNHTPEDDGEYDEKGRWFKYK